jgi:uncharacterized phiE125 gp8 family phage protein
MQLSLYTAPTDEPLLLAQAKQHLRISGTAEDAYLLALIAVARRECEQRTGRCLVTQTWDVRYDSFAEAVRGSQMHPPRSPVQSVTHVKYHDTAGVQQTWPSNQYQLARGLAPRLAPVEGVSWPSTGDRMQAVEIRLVCGYGEPDAVPEELAQWMLLMIGHWFENREAVTQRTMSRLPFVDGLLDRESLVVVG